MPEYPQQKGSVMGWKNLKNHYRISHIVQITEQGICIGSGYIHDLIVIGLDGDIKKRYGDRLSSNADLARYQQEMDADPATLRALVQSPDTFSTGIHVYTYDGGAILEKQCETPLYPNVTHDGCLMYENTFSTDKDEVVEWAKRNCDAAIRCVNESIQRLEHELAAARTELTQHQANRSQLEGEYPGNPAAATGHSPSPAG